MHEKRRSQLKQGLPGDWHHAGIRQLADFLGVAPPKILAWIRNGELIAANIATRHTSRPIFRIARADFDRFWESRKAVQARPVPIPKPRRARTAPIKSFV